jgi:hypothetical protein
MHNSAAHLRAKRRHKAALHGGACIGLARQRRLAAQILGEAAVLRCAAPISAATTGACGLDLG